MGIKDLWSVLTPYAEKKPMCSLRGKVVAIDLAGWVCESLNVVDYFVHPRHHLKNLFFRTCYLIFEEVTPVFVLEGVAPELKSEVIKKRNEVQFRGVDPKKRKGPKNAANKQTANCIDDKSVNNPHVRTRFNHVLKQCENLLRAMGITCVQGPGEGEAYCAYLNEKGLVHGVISQDSDCFAYGAKRVYRNFSISNQGALAAQGGSLDIYDMDIIRSKMDFGQNKIIAMALLCGCDYCPDGIGGIGRDSVLKLFSRYKDHEILQHLRSWRLEHDKYTTLELRVDDKNICTNCGHLGRTQSHSKKGCNECRTKQGCQVTSWKEERLSLKAEVTLRQKALSNPSFPREDIICEFLSKPKDLLELTLKWNQPNLVKFVKHISELLQWTELYSFQKIFPLLTRWYVQNIHNITQSQSTIISISPKEIVKKRTIKGLPSLEVIWKDENNCFMDLIPEEQLEEFKLSNPNDDIKNLWTTVEPLNLMESAFPELVEMFLKSKEKPKKKSKTNLITKKQKKISTITELNEKGVKRNKKELKKESCLIYKYFQRNLQNKSEASPKTITKPLNVQCSTPLGKCTMPDLENYDVNESQIDMSGIINNIVYKREPIFKKLNTHKGKALFYEKLAESLCESEKQQSHVNNECFDDLILLQHKRSLSTSFIKVQNPKTKRISLDDSFDVLVKMGNNKHSNVDCKYLEDSYRMDFGIEGNINKNDTNNDANVSYFFSNDCQEDDAFEKCVETTFMRYNTENDCSDDDLIILD